MTGNAPPQHGATLRLNHKADKQIAELPTVVLGAVYKFLREFRRNPHATGFHLEKLKGDSALWSARVNRQYRALLVDLGGNDWLLVAVKAHKDVYDNLDRHAASINRVTGAIEYVDLDLVGDSVLQPATAQPPEPTPEVPQQPSEVPGRPLFDTFTDAQLRELGVVEALLPLVRKLTEEEELLSLAEFAPQHTGDVLLRLHDSDSYETVLEEVTRPVQAEEPVDAEDWGAAVHRSQVFVLTEDDALQNILKEPDFGRWRTFLHPSQAKLVQRRTSGPTRVSGGPGTGKTIVALHRVKDLVDRLPPGRSKPILLTTFNRNLAVDLRNRLLTLGGPGTFARVDVISIDKLAAQVVREADSSGAKRLLRDNETLREWQRMLEEAGEDRWEPSFLNDEWNQVILGQAAQTRSEYFRARRAGRGRSVNRAERAEIWQLAERFTQRLDRLGMETYRQVAERAARIEGAHKERVEAQQTRQDDADGMLNIHAEAGSRAQRRYRYRHIVVDEAQDLSPAHWKLLRAMVPNAPDDVFLVGDTHQRLYDHQVTLGSLGVHIRGRSSRLTLSYRSTNEILRQAHELLQGGARYDDLDGGIDDLSGYRSVLHGEKPSLRGLSTWQEELDAVVEQLGVWQGVRNSAIAICVPTNEMVTQTAVRLQQAGIPRVEITAEGPRQGEEGVHIGTMYRFKGLEYQCMILAGVTEGLVPRHAIDKWQHTDSARYERELQRARSLLFVAATRARDALAVLWHGEPSRFLGSTAKKER